MAKGDIPTQDNEAMVDDIVQRLVDERTAHQECLKMR